MIKILKEGGFDVWACSDASFERVNGYFKNAGFDWPENHIISADEVGKGKPEAAVYKHARQKVGADEPGEVSVFAGESAFWLLR